MPANQSPFPNPGKEKLNFENTEIAFRSKSNADLETAYWLFKIISINFLTRVGPPITNWAMKIGLPLKPLIKATIFKHFCGGETIEECESTIVQLDNGGVGSILDYSVEGEDDESVFEATCSEILRTVERADGDSRVPFSVFKVTGLGRFTLLEKKQSGMPLDVQEQEELDQVFNRVDQICRLAFERNVAVMIDAEESWIQQTIDDMALEMMRRYNRNNVIVINTYQLYRNDKLSSMKADHQRAINEGFLFGSKLVRGAYMEKERKRAEDMGYASPINADKHATDTEYNAAITYCLNNLDSILLIAGTHNEKSCQLLANSMLEGQIPLDHKHVYFSQLLGMSDNLSFNLAAAGYQVAKYVPYGPVKAVMPYLFRRAQENTSVAGQMGRELALISKEKKRRSAAIQG